MSRRALSVAINGRTVGTLADENDIWSFEYAQEWRDADDGFDLSPALDRAAGRHTDGASRRSVQWYFDNLLPEEHMRTLLAEEAAIPSEDAFGLLAYFGAESAGSLELVSPDRQTTGNAASQTGLKPLPFAELSRRIANLRHAHSLSKDAPKKMSLAGAQHKLLVVARGAALFEPLRGTPSTSLLKPLHPSGDYPASVANEYFTMKLARRMKLDVPDVQHIYVPQPVYVVKRFDRAIRDDGEATRLHAIDACQLLDKSRQFKYTAASVSALAEAIGLCRTKAAARLQLFRWLVFNLLVGNSDNHLKNVSFMVDAGGITLAPAYDLLSTAAYDTRALAEERGKWPDVALSLPVGEARTFAQVDRSAVIAGAAALGLARHAAERELDAMLRGIATAADDLIGACLQEFTAAAKASPDPQQARDYLAGEERVLRAIRHVIIADMANRLSH